MAKKQVNITAIKIEKTYTKSEILELYFNSVYFGHGTYGVQAASLYYFGKDISKKVILPHIWPYMDLLWPSFVQNSQI